MPCASGEEPLTIAMMLDMAGWFGRAPIEIHASDASPAQVARARAGRYRERSFRALPANLRERYFRADGDAWVPDAALASRITSWSVVNLMDRERVAPLARAPVIFCRNVFIYFSQDGVRDVVNRFADLMPSPGVSVRRRLGVAAARHEPVRRSKRSAAPSCTSNGDERRLQTAVVRLKPDAATVMNDRHGSLPTSSAS